MKQNYNPLSTTNDPSYLRKHSHTSRFQHQQQLARLQPQQHEVYKPKQQQQEQQLAAKQQST